ncbi:hypothetical protein EV645_4298 [Kribbella rubisoli]|uniref:Uncharacterized protein n=1 Tax=Kribbella rubisoli TaxID=3075929 RepID=A0A4V2FXF0_9ACTN|nr:hypothetical protein [Kribbella rubisoli]RZU13456.1 hypothetical protein EV645_4298 [Kribbella rubisoli]
MSDERSEFSAAEIVDLLAELDKRLKKRGTSASVFVVGGAAIAVTSNDNPRRTEDIDAITRDGGSSPTITPDRQARYLWIGLDLEPQAARTAAHLTSKASGGVVRDHGPHAVGARHNADGPARVSHAGPR